MENNNEKKRNWSVYKHTCIISKKSYIGITSRKPQNRWGKNGNNYLVKENGMYSHKKFAKAILIGIDTKKNID